MCCRRDGRPQHGGFGSGEQRGPTPEDGQHVGAVAARVLMGDSRGRDAKQCAAKQARAVGPSPVQHRLARACRRRIDHIHWELASPAPGGGAAEGARFRIVEAFGARPEFKVDVVDRVEKLDETGIRLVQRLAGVVIFQLEHAWSAGTDATHYVSVMDIGARSGLLAPINGVICRRFSDEMLRAWVKHNIEEVGQLEYLLPQLKSSAEPANT